MRCPGTVSCLTSLPVRRRLWGRSTTIDRLASGTAGVPVEEIMEVRERRSGYSVPPAVLKQIGDLAVDGRALHTLC